MTPVTVLGLGPMGRALAAAFAAANHPTTVWNRTPGKETGLAATVAAAAADAISASPLVVVCVLDYPAAEAILDATALKGRTLVNLSGGSPEQARSMATWAQENGIDYLDGVIMATTDSIGGPDAALFYSGPRDVYARHQPTLAALGGSARYLGEAPGRASAFDTSLQDMMWTSMSGVAHMFAFAASENIAASEIVPHAKALLGFFPEMIDMLAAQIESGEFSGAAGSISQTAVILDNILRPIRANGVDNGVLGAVRAQVQRAIDSGHGSDGFGRLAALPAS